MAVFHPPAAIRTQVYRQGRITIYYPQVTGLANRQAEQHINRMIIDAVQQLQREQLQVQTGTHLDMIGRFEIKTNERGLLSLTLSNYAYSYPMAHGNTVLKALTFDTATGKSYALSDLFKPGSDYAAVLSAQVAQQIKQRNIPTLGDFKGIRPDQGYYLADKALVLFFPLYEITPYYVGFPMFPISVYDVLPLAADPGPLNTLAADIA
ncbi:DUF3298 and DUF4163 domain-containing protein [Paenibacillus sp. y28]|uniref:DUF3298 and DUF4163 domain-containing protein n=1 Tax=Paenibacillus sp. y28 TaxID=3129110 RepID=UPI003019C7B7